MTQTCNDPTKRNHFEVLIGADKENLDSSLGFQMKVNLNRYILPVENPKSLRQIVENLKAALTVPMNKSVRCLSNWRNYARRLANDGVDQIADIVERIKKRKYDRRILLVDYNPTDGDDSGQLLMQFYMDVQGALSCKTYQSRGTMTGLLNGDMARPILLTYMLCHVCDLVPGDFIHTFGQILMDANEYSKSFTVGCLFPTVSIVGGRYERLEDFTEDSFVIGEGLVPLSNAGLIGIDYHGHTDANGQHHEELQYLRYVQDIIEHGWKLSDRTGVGTRSIFGGQMRFSLGDGTLPLLTTKRVFYRGIIEELLWFLRGSTNGNELTERGVHIWDANGSEEFLKQVGLGHRQRGDLGPVYGFQWRHFGADYSDMHSDYEGKGVDQISKLIEGLKNRSKSNGHVVLAWNPNDLPMMALPPCHCLVQFFVTDDKKLSCKLYQRSCDMGLGVPFNIASYAILTHMIAYIAGFEPGYFIHTLGDAHVYLNHTNALEMQAKREPRDFPKLKFRRKLSRIEDFTIDDFEIIGYNPHPKIAMEMAV